MNPMNIANATEILVAPQDWSNQNGPCQSLAVIRDGDLIYSFWRPTWKERILILFGCPIQVCVLGSSQPPIALGVV